jgi:hypothetical protein
MSEHQSDHQKLMRYFLDREIVNFHNFLTILDSHLDARRQELSNSIELADSKLEGVEENDELRKEWIDLKVEAEQVKGFANLLRQSFLTSLYSFMELWLMRECHLDSKRRDGGKSYKATKGKGIEKAKRYFTSLMQSGYPFGLSQDWLWMTNFQLLRDCIIHRQGSLTGFSDFEIDSTLAKFVDSESGLSLFGPDNKQIFVEREFCGRALQIVHRFMIEILALETKTG